MNYHKHPPVAGKYGQRMMEQYWEDRAHDAYAELTELWNDDAAMDEWYDQAIDDSDNWPTISYKLHAKIDAMRHELTQGQQDIRRTARHLAEFQDTHPRPEYN